MTHAEQMRQWRKNNPEKLGAINRRFYLKHKLHILARNKKWLGEQPNYEKNRSRRRRTENPLLIQSYQRKYRAAHREKLRAANRLYGATHRKERTQRALYRYHKNLAVSRATSVRAAQIRRARMLGVYCDFTDEQWQTMKSSYGRRCAYCGCEKKLTMDHVVPVSRGGNHTASNIVPACLSCNSRKKTKIWRPFYPGESVMAA